MVKKLTFSLPFAFPFINGFCSESGGYHHSFSKNLFCRAHSLDPTPSTGVQKSSISITTDHVSWEIPALEHAKCWKSRVQSWQKNKKLAADLASWFLGGEVVWERSWFMEDVRLAEGYLGSKWTHPFKKKSPLIKVSKVHKFPLLWGRFFDFLVPFFLLFLTSETYPWSTVHWTRSMSWPIGPAEVAQHFLKKFRNPFLSWLDFWVAQKTAFCNTT